MRINPNVTVLNMQSILSRDKEEENQNKKLTSGLKISGIELVYNNKVISLTRDIDKADDVFIKSKTSLKDAINTTQQTTGILTDMREEIHKVKIDEITNEEYESIKEKISNMIEKLSNIASDKSNSKWFNCGSISNLDIDISTDKDVSVSLQTIEELLTQYEDKFDELSSLNEKMDAMEATNENLLAATSRIQDVSMAEDVIGSIKSNMLNNSSIAILSQFNKNPQQIFNLLE